MTKEEKTLLTNELLSRFPLYGEFEMLYIHPSEIIDASTFLDPQNDILARTLESLARQRIIQETYQNETQIIQELIFGGFIINRHDIKVEGKTYRQLTDKGRELKEQGSLEAYEKLQRDKKDAIFAENDRLEKLENAQRESQNKMNTLTFVIAVGTTVAALYYLKELLTYFW